MWLEHVFKLKMSPELFARCIPNVSDLTENCLLRVKCEHKQPNKDHIQRHLMIDMVNDLIVAIDDYMIQLV